MRKSARQLAMEAEFLDQAIRKNNPNSIEWLQPVEVPAQAEVAEQEAVQAAEEEQQDIDPPELPEAGSPAPFDPIDSPDQSDSAVEAAEVPEPDIADVPEFDSVASGADGDLSSAQDLALPESVGSFDVPDLETADAEEQSIAEFDGPDLPSDGDADPIGEPESPETPEIDLPDVPEIQGDASPEFPAPSPQIANTDLADDSEPELPDNEELDFPETEVQEQSVEEVDTADANVDPDFVPTFDDAQVPEQEEFAPEYVDAAENATESVTTGDIDYPEFPVDVFDQIQPPSQSVDELNTPEQPESSFGGLSGFQGIRELPPVTREELELEELNDPSVTAEQRSEAQYEMHRKSSEEFASQLARELDPQFEIMRYEQAHVTRSYVDEQLLLNSILRVR